MWEVDWGTFQPWVLEHHGSDPFNLVGKNEQRRKDRERRAFVAKLVENHGEENVTESMLIATGQWTARVKDGSYYEIYDL